MGFLLGGNTTTAEVPGSGQQPRTDALPISTSSLLRGRREGAAGVHR